MKNWLFSGSNCLFYQRLTIADLYTIVTNSWCSLPCNVSSLLSRSSPGREPGRRGRKLPPAVLRSADSAAQDLMKTTKPGFVAAAPRPIYGKILGENPTIKYIYIRIYREYIKHGMSTNNNPMIIWSKSVKQHFFLAYVKAGPKFISWMLWKWDMTKPTWHVIII